MYEGSSLRAGNDAELEATMAQRSTIRRATLAELAIQHATVTPFWWGLWIMLRVGLVPHSLCCPFVLTSSHGLLMLACAPNYV